MNDSKYVKIIVFLATIVTMLVGNFVYDLSKTIDFGKVTGKIAFMQLIMVLIGFLACLIMTLLYIFVFDPSRENFFRWIVTISLICLTTFVMVKFVVPTTLPMFLNYLIKRN